MDNESLYKFYKIHVDSVNEDETFNYEGNIFQLIQLKNDDFDELYERYKMALHLYKGGVSNILMPVRNNSDDVRTWHENNVYVLLMKTNLEHDESVGKSLANFHLKGRNFSETTNETSRFGTWMELWGRRLEQIESLWQEKCFNRPKSEFEKMFVEYFPYYLGLAESALNYLSDSEKDTTFRDSDFATICHSKYNPVKFANEKNPFDWVYDHPMRDVAEYVRNSFFENPLTYAIEVNVFFKEYLSELPITTKSAKFLLARLLLPLNFFETIERYFTVKSEQVRNEMSEKIEREVRLSNLYEKMICDIFDTASIPEMYKTVRIPEWLVKTK